MPSFGTQQQSNTDPLTDVELNEQKAKLLQDISYLGQKKEELDNSLKQSVVLKDEGKDLAKQIKTQREKLDDTKKKTELALSELSKITKEVGSQQSELAKIQDVSEKVSVDLIPLKSESDTLSADIVRKQKEVAELDSAIKIANDVWNKALVDVKQRQTQIEALDKTVATKEEALKSTIGGLELRISELSGMKKELESENTKLVDESLRFSEQLILHNREIEIAQQKAVEIIEIADKEAVIRMEEVEKLKLDLQEREGRLSVEKLYLEEKVIKLKKIKVELEKFYNRTIPQINF